MFEEGDGVEEVLEGVGSDGRVAVCDGAEFVELVLEEVGVDGADLEVVLFGEGGDLLGGFVLREVPEDVEGDGGGGAGEFVDLGGVGEFFFDGGGRGFLEELAEAGAGVGVAPGGGFDLEAGEAGGDAVGEVHGGSLWEGCAMRGRAPLPSPGLRPSALTGPLPPAAGEEAEEAACMFAGAIDLGAMSGSDSERREALVLLSHELGREDRGMAILGEGNASTRCADGLLIKASGRNLGALARDGVVACRGAPLVGLMDSAEAPDERVEEALMASRVDPAAPKPSVEAIFHAYLLSLPGVEWVGHVHPVSVNGILCSKRAAEFAARRVFPDEVVCCGAESVFVPYVDPGLRLAVVIRREVEAFIQRRREQPRVIVLANHGVITLGGTASAVLGAMLMVSKAAAIWHGAVAMGGPTFLSEADVARIAGRADEHYRQRALNL